MRRPDRPLRQRPGQWRRTWLCCLLLGLLATGCLYDPYYGFGIENRTDQDLLIFSGEEKVNEVSAGSTGGIGLSGDDCESWDLVARTAAGVEVDRYSDPLCSSETWVILPGQ